MTTARAANSAPVTDESLRELGLSAGAAADRLARYGPNEVTARPRVPLWARVASQLRDPLILVLLGAAALTLATSDLPDALIILTVVVINTTVGVAQEVRADHAIAALSALAAPHTRVRRDGTELDLAARDVVPGDVVLLGEGDIVPADADLDEAQALLIDESSLTGESVSVAKAAGDAVSAGTTVVRGRGVATVSATGRDSALGRIAQLLDTHATKTPLQRRLAELGRVLSAVAIALCLVVFAIGLARGEPLERMAITAISLAVAAVPESLPAVVTLSLALGARRMARHHAIVRRLPAVETLGSVTVLATDKTGTLTEGRMVAEEIWTPVGTGLLDGIGYAPVGSLTVDGRTPAVDETVVFVELLTTAALCNDATLVTPEADAEWSGLGDPTELALLSAAGKLGISRDAAESAAPRLAEIPFDSGRMRMTTVHREDGVLRICTKGALESLVGGEILLGTEPDVLTAATAAAADLAARGFRVLAIASGHLERPPDDPDDYERGLRLHGLVGIADPPRDTARETVRRCQEAGMIPVLITGDHPETARAIAVRVGVMDDGSDESVVLGDHLRDGTVPDPTVARVFARIDPGQKLDIIDAWQRNGAVVAMTGDGVNDAPALHRADIGVAMGMRGTEVARQAADLVLADDELATLVAAVEEGRRVYANVRRFLLYALAGGIAEILVMLAGPFVGLALPLLAGQILWVNLLTHGLTGVALGAEPTAPDVMRQPPRSPAESILGRGLWQGALAAGAIITVVCIALALWAHGSGREWQSMLFIALTSLQLGVALGSRARPGTLANPFLLLAVPGSLLLVLAGVYLPPLQTLLSTRPVPLADAAIAVATGLVGWVMMRVRAWLRVAR